MNRPPSLQSQAVVTIRNHRLLLHRWAAAVAVVAAPVVPGAR